MSKIMFSSPTEHGFYSVTISHPPPPPRCTKKIKNLSVYGSAFPHILNEQREHPFFHQRQITINNQNYKAWNPNPPFIHLKRKIQIKIKVWLLFLRPLYFLILNFPNQDNLSIKMERKNILFLFYIFLGNQTQSNAAQISF